MSATTVAKKDFADAVRSRTLMVLTAVFALFTVGGAALASYLGELFAEIEGESAESTLDLVFALQTPASFLVPIIALVITYKAIAGERESGSLKFLLGQPHTRRDVVLGKILGRSAVVAVSIFVGFAAGLVGLFVFVGSVSIADYLAFTVVTLLFGFVYVCIGVGISSVTKSTTRAAVGALGLVVFFWMIWGIILQILLYFVEGTFLPPYPDWFIVLSSLTPDGGYGAATAAALGEDQFSMVVADESQEVVEGSVPLVTEPWFGFLLLAIWALVPLAVGLWRFDRVDL